MTQRKFIPGSEWLYLKIYTGVKTADIILEEAIQPLVEYFRENNYISNWFFIRYNDPKPHLRVRFKLHNTKYYNEVLCYANTVFQEYVNSGEISTIVIDIYNREIERYGQDTMESAETLFNMNSDFTLSFLHYDDEEKIIVSLFYIDELFSRLNLSAHEKLTWTKEFNDAFKKEFNADKKLNSQLDKKYRVFKSKFIDFVQAKDFSEERDFITSNIKSSNTALQYIVHSSKNRFLEISLKNFFQSIFHMNINRLFVSNQRLFEMIIYDYLLRYYKAITYHLSL
ncbi:thiopeptide-type bacteriocin biosynthesis protein [Chryseobacterium flavum]|uniref:thiopeptide-type bacteriocin biosynthesis protein n=1 Tax=Chryseobacterium flavum TaxID=415851 RepID=UPI0028A605C3|nr:thiopeptide-type bacteriocin biosynthesis protein [Chryseobacterium flavum]